MVRNVAWSLAEGAVGKQLAFTANLKRFIGEVVELEILTCKIVRKFRLL